MTNKLQFSVFENYIYTIELMPEEEQAVAAWAMICQAFGKPLPENLTQRQIRFLETHEKLFIARSVGGNPNFIKGKSNLYYDEARKEKEMLARMNFDEQYEYLENKRKGAA